MPRTSKNTQHYHDIVSEIAAKFEPLISKGQYPSLATLISAKLTPLDLHSFPLAGKDLTKNMKNSFLLALLMATPKPKSSLS